MVMRLSDIDKQQSGPMRLSDIPDPNTKPQRLSDVAIEPQQNKTSDEELLRQIEDTDKKLYKATLEKQAVEGGLSPFSKPTNDAENLLNQKQSLYKNMKERGYDPNTVNFALDVRKKVNAPRYGRMIGAGLAATGASLLTGGFEPTDLITWPTAFRAAAAGLGGLGGEATQSKIEEGRLISPKEAGMAFLTEMGTEVGSAAGMKVAKNTVLRPFVKKPVNNMSVDEINNLKNKFAEFGGKFAPTEIDKRMGVNISEGVGRGAFGANALWDEFNKQQGDSAKLFADKIIRSITNQTMDTPEELSQQFASSIESGGRVMGKIDDFFDDLYGKIDDMTKSKVVKKTAMQEVPSNIVDETGKPLTKQVEQVVGKETTGARVSTKPLKEWAMQKIADNDALLKVGEEGRNVLFDEGSRKALEDILALGDEIGFGGMRKLRSRFLTKTLQYGRDINPDKGLIKELEGVITNTLFDISNAKGLNPEAINLLKNTNRLYAETSQMKDKVFKEALVDTIYKNPSKGINQILPDNNPESIKKMRESLFFPTGRTNVDGSAIAADPEGILMWDKLRQAKLADIVNNVFTPEGTVTKGTVDTTFKKIGDKAIKELFPNGEISDLKNTLTLLSKKTAGSGGANTLLVRSAQASGAGMILYGGYGDNNYLSILGGSALVLGPMAFAKLATTKTGLSLLTAGFKNTGSTPLPALAARMANYLKQQDEMQAKKEEYSRRELEFRSRPQRNKLYQKPSFNIQGNGSPAFAE